MSHSATPDILLGSNHMLPSLTNEPESVSLPIEKRCVANFLLLESVMTISSFIFARGTLSLFSTSNFARNASLVTASSCSIRILTTAQTPSSSSQVLS